jgi:hypothetical protein
VCTRRREVIAVLHYASFLIDMCTVFGESQEEKCLFLFLESWLKRHYGFNAWGCAKNSNTYRSAPILFNVLFVIKIPQYNGTIPLC